MEERNNMENVTKIMPLLWSFIQKHKRCSVGISSIEDKVIITLLWGKIRWKKFAGKDMILLQKQVSDYLQVV